MIAKELLQEGIKKFGGIEHSYKLLGGFYNNVYEVEREDERIVLKWLPASEYSPSLLRGELDWIRYLSDRGVPVARGIASKRGEMVEKVELEQVSYLVIAFEKAEGTFVDHQNKEEWNRHLFKKWGKVMGRIHQLAKDYIPSDGALRPEWHEGSLFRDARVSIGSGMMKKWKEHVQELHKLPQDQGSFGLIHNDLHQRNFHLADDQLILFDFGDCEYGWFAYDIAISLYHALESVPREKQQQRSDFAHYFLESFLAGYTEEKSLDHDWIARIPFLLDFRQIFSYCYLINHLDLRKLTTGQRRYLEQMRTGIESGVSYVKLDL